MESYRGPQREDTCGRRCRPFSRHDLGHLLARERFIRVGFGIQTATRTTSAGRVNERTDPVGLDKSVVDFHGPLRRYHVDGHPLLPQGLESARRDPQTFPHPARKDHDTATDQPITSSGAPSAAFSLWVSASCAAASPPMIPTRIEARIQTLMLDLLQKSVCDLQPQCRTTDLEADALQRHRKGMSSGAACRYTSPGRLARGS